MGSVVTLPGAWRYRVSGYPARRFDIGSVVTVSGALL